MAPLGNVASRFLRYILIGILLTGRANVHRIVPKSGYQMNVLIRIGNKTVEEWTYHSANKYATPHRLTRRDVDEDLADDPAQCIPAEAMSTDRLSQSAFVAQLGGTVTLPCQLCGEEDDFTPRNWLKFERILNGANQLLWHPTEVRLDVFSNELLNRVYVNSSHALTIKEFQPDDVGTYFCTEYTNLTEPALEWSFTSPAVEELGAVALGLAWQQENGDQSIDHLFHVDVGVYAPTVLVSQGAPYDGLAVPMEPIINEEDNWRTVTTWGAWSECTVCGNAGERRRQGQCLLKRFHSSEPVFPEYLNHTLNLYPAGAPCLSSLFHGYDEIHQAYNEIEIGPCPFPCSDNALVETYGIDLAIGLTTPAPATTFRPTTDPDESSIYHNVEGEALYIPCEKRLSGSTVIWMNTTGDVLTEAFLLETTGGRITVDEHHSLNFSSLQLNDTSIYYCLESDDFRVEAIVLVSAAEEPEESIDLWQYQLILLYSFGADFVIFLFVCGTRHRQRRRQVKRPKDKKSKSREKIVVEH